MGKYTQNVTTKCLDLRSENGVVLVIWDRSTDGIYYTVNGVTCVRKNIQQLADDPLRISSS